MGLERFAMAQKGSSFEVKRRQRRSHSGRQVRTGSAWHSEQQKLSGAGCRYLNESRPSERCHQDRPAQPGLVRHEDSHAHSLFLEFLQDIDKTGSLTTSSWQAAWRKPSGPSFLPAPASELSPWPRGATHTNRPHTPPKASQLLVESRRLLGVVSGHTPSNLTGGLPPG